MIRAESFARRGERAELTREDVRATPRARVQSKGLYFGGGQTMEMGASSEEGGGPGPAKRPVGL